MKKLRLYTTFSRCYLLLAVVMQGYIGSSLVFGQNINIKHGVNIQASYYNRGDVNLGWELMNDYPEIEALRIEIEPYRATQAIQWVREAHKEGYQVIATYHRADLLGSDDKEELVTAAKWWRDQYRSYITKGPIIINIMNEWGSHNLSPEEYAAAYNEAIPIIREVYDGPLIVDVPGFGQATRIAGDAFPLFQDTNIIFSVHLYSNAFNQAENRWLNEEDLTYLAAVGAKCMVGEFCDNKRGGADWCSLIDYCYQNDWPLFGWAWNGDGGSMNMITPHWRDQPLATSFQPTPLMDRIIDKLAGVPCYTQPSEDCHPSLIGMACDDENDYTINDRYNEFCHCTGRFTGLLNSVISDNMMVIYPNPVGHAADLFIELVKTKESGMVRIYNSSGQEVKAISIIENTNLVQVEISNLPDGIYWVNFSGTRNTFISSKFVK